MNIPPAPVIGAFFVSGYVDIIFKNKYNKSNKEIYSCR